MSNVYKINNVGGTTDLVEPLILGFEQTYPLSYSAWGAWLGPGAGAGLGAGASGASGGVSLGFRAATGGEHLEGRCGPFPHLGSLGAECECV